MSLLNRLRCWRGALMAMAALFGLLAPGLSKADLPAVKLARGTLSSTSTGWGFYGTALTHSNSISSWASAPTPPEILALAKSLGSARAVASEITATQYTQNVYDYIRNNIATEFRFGLGKGARGALIDQSGTPFDQAELMVKLLAQGNVSATYQVGEITLTTQQFGSWTGLIHNLNVAAQTFGVDAQAACHLLADGGIPAAVNGVSDCSSGSLSGDLSTSGSTITMAHIWVSANGNLYDPSFKRHTFKTGVTNLASAMGCSGTGCGASAITAMLSGTAVGQTGGAATLHNPNGLGVNVSGVLNTAAVNLENWTRSNLPQGQLDDLIGGMRIDISYSPAPAATLDHGATTKLSFSASNGMPDQFRSRLQVNVANGGASLISRTFYADEIAGQRLRTYAYSGNFYLYVENNYTDTFTYSCRTDLESGIQGACNFTVSLTATHPYTTIFANQAMPAAPANAPTSILSTWGETSVSSQLHFADLEKVSPSPFVGASGSSPQPPPSSSSPLCTGTLVTPQCRNDAAPAAMAQIAAQSDIADQALANISAVRIGHQHRLGLMTNVNTPVETYAYDNTDGGQYLTMSTADSLEPVVFNISPAPATLEAATLLDTMQESAVMQQVMGFNYFAVGSPLLIFNSTATLADFESQAELLAAFPNVQSTNPDLWSSWVGGGYGAIIPTGSIYNGKLPCVTANKMIIYGFGSDRVSPSCGPFKGAGGVADPTAVLATAKTAALATNWKGVSTVNPASGDLAMAPPPDIVSGAGEFPYSLPFRRFYNSLDPVIERNESIPIRTQNCVQTGIDGAGNPIESCADSYGYTGAPDNGMTDDYTTTYSGPDADVFSRIGGGWTHNYQVSLNFEGNAQEGMGSTSALNASAFVAGLSTLADLMRSPGFNQRVTAGITVNWIASQLAFNSVRISLPPSTEVFVKLPSGAFSRPLGSQDSLSQTGAPLLVASGLPVYDFQPVTFALTRSDGSVINFDSAANVSDGGGVSSSGQCATGYSCSSVAGLPVFKADSWAFPSGVNITFNYTSISTKPNSLRNNNVLTSVSNSLGRSLSFMPTLESDTGSASVALITSVTDETNRQIKLQLSSCPANWSNNGGGFQTPTFFACNTLKVTAPDGQSVLTYDYTPGSDSPDPAVTARATYRVRRWSRPSDTTGAFESFVYDELGRISSETDRLGRTSRFYSGAVAGSEPSKVGVVIDPLNYVTTIRYDQWNDVLQSVDPLGYTTTYAYDTAHRKTSEQGPHGDWTSYDSYDVRSNLLQSTHHPAAGSSLAAVVKSTTYMEGASVYSCSSPATCNQPLYEIDGDNNRTDYGWNTSTGQLSSLTRGLNTSDACALAGGICPLTQYSYTSMGGVSFLTTKTDKVSPTVSSAQSQVTTYAYNSSNKYVLQSATVDPTSANPSGLNLTTNFAFDSYGDLTSVTDPLGHVSNAVWDADRRLTLAIAADPGTGKRTATRYVYNADGGLKEVDKGSTTSATGSDFAVAEVTAYAYDAVGNSIQEQVYNGATNTSSNLPLTLTQMSYDSDDRVKCSAIRLNGAIFGNLAATAVSGSSVASALPSGVTACTQSSPTGSDGQDHITQWNYDADGHKLAELRGVGSSLPITYSLYTFTGSGKPSTVRDANNNMTTYTYDDFDRLYQTQYPVAALSAYQSNTSDYEAVSQYDANDNIITRRRRDGGTISYQYDSLNRPSSKTVPPLTGTGTPSVTVNTKYDLLDHPLSALFASSSQGVVWEYDLAERRTSETTFGRKVSIKYDGAGNRSQLTYPDGQAMSYGFDAANRFASVGNTNASVSVANTGYDLLGRLNALTRSNNAPTNSISYDNADRLAGFTHAFPAGSATWNSFKYTTAGQLTQFADNVGNYDSSAAIASQNVTPDGLNRNGSIATISGYDAEGNLINDGSRQFVYDGENRLVSETGSANMSLSYDPTGRLYSSVINGVTTQFLYDGDALVAEYDGSGNLLRRYVHGAGVDQPFIWFEGSGVASANARFFYADRQGSILAVADSNGAVITGLQYAYDPYGAPSSWTGSRFLYTGQIALPGTNLYYYKARIYDPSAGRFLQTDPIGYRDDLNLYAYVGDDPANKTDPTGNCPECLGFAIGAGLGAGAEIVKEHWIERRDFHDLDWSSVGKEALIGGSAGAIGVGAGRLLENVSVVGQAALSGAASSGSSSAMHGDKPADVLVNAAIGGAAGGASKYVSGTLSKSLTKLGPRIPGNPIQMGSITTPKYAKVVGSVTGMATSKVITAVGNDDCRAADLCKSVPNQYGNRDK